MQFKLFDIQIGWDDGIFATAKGAIYYLFMIIALSFVYAFFSFSYVSQNSSMFTSESSDNISYFDNFRVDKNYFSSNIQQDTIISPLCCVK